MRALLSLLAPGFQSTPGGTAWQVGQESDGCPDAAGSLPCFAGNAERHGGLPAVTDTEYGRRRHPLRLRGRNVAWVPPLLLLVGIVLLDLNTTERFRIITWIVLVPGTAAAICGVWTTGAFAVLAVVTYVAVDSAWPGEYQAGLGDFVLVAVGGLL